MTNDIVPTYFKKSEAYLAAIEKSKEIMKNSRFNIFQSSPIICKSDACPYYDTCPIQELVDTDGLQGTRCPYELTLAASLTDKYVKHFVAENEINTMDEVDPITLDLIKELVDYDVQISRADRIMANKGDFLDEIVTGITPQGELVTNKEIAKWVEYKNSLIDKKHKTMQLLNSTPKDKASTAKMDQDFASYVAELKERAMKLANVIDVTDASDIGES